MQWTWIGYAEMWQFSLIGPRWLSWHNVCALCKSRFRKSIRERISSQKFVCFGCVPIDSTKNFESAFQKAKSWKKLKIIELSIVESTVLNDGHSPSMFAIRGADSVWLFCSTRFIQFSKPFKRPKGRTFRTFQKGQLELLNFAETTLLEIRRLPLNVYRNWISKTKASYVQ